MSNKVELLMEMAVQDIVAYIVEDTGKEFDEAMREFYLSSVFEKLHDESTGLYLEGSAYLYELYKSERRDGVLVQNEI